MNKIWLVLIGLLGFMLLLYGEGMGQENVLVVNVKKNFIGIPIEGFGFKDGLMGTFGPPSFNKVKFKWEGKLMYVEVPHEILLSGNGYLCLSHL